VAVKRIYWHRELPPIGAEDLGEHRVVARSDAVDYHWSERNALWARCVRSLHRNLERRLGQEIERLGGSFAHVLDERIVPRIDRAGDQYWLEGRFDYVLYRVLGEDA
jgi:hypothetical protein